MNWRSVGWLLAPIVVLGCLGERAVQTSSEGQVNRRSDRAAMVMGRGGLLVDSGSARAIQRKLIIDVALALRDSTLRQLVFNAIAASRLPEHKIELGSFLRGSGDPLLAAVGSIGGRNRTRVLAALDSLPDLEVYLPVPEHFATWRGDRNLLVAGDLHDGELPLVIDLQGRPVPGVDAEVPPRIPTLVLVPAETDFSHVNGDRGNATCVSCPPPCQGISCGGGNPPPPNILSLFGVEISNDHEGWPNGSPEFELWVYAGDAQGNPLLGNTVYDPNNPPGSQTEDGSTITFLTAAGCIGYFANNAKHWGYQAINTWRTYGSPPPIFTNSYVARNDTLNWWLLVAENDDDTHCDDNGGFFPSVGNPNFQFDDDDKVGRIHFPQGHLKAWHTPTFLDVDSLWLNFAP